MNREQYLLSKLSEELAEVIQEVQKAQQFGVDEIYEKVGVTNGERIWRELTDVYAVLEMLSEEGYLRDIVFDKDACEAKKEKVNKYYEYAKSIGKISGG